MRSLGTWIAPDAPQKFRRRHDRAVTLDQNAEQLSLPFREPHLLPVPIDATLGSIHLKPFQRKYPARCDAAPF